MLLRFFLNVFIKTNMTFNIAVPYGILEINKYIILGPNPATVPIFWLMVWNERVDSIVMVTNIVEKGKVRLLYKRIV